MKRFENFLDGMRTPRKIVISRGSLIGVVLALTACLTTPLWAAPFSFATGTANGLLAALSQRPSPGKAETETADDFVLQETTVINRATITRLIFTRTPVENIRDVEVEVYHIFPRDSDVGRTSGAPMFSTTGTFTISARVPNASFPVGF